MEPQHQHFAVQRIQLQQRGQNLFPVFHVRQAIKRSRLMIGNFKGHRLVIVAACLKQLVQAAHRPLSPLVDHQVARNRKQPGLKPGLPVELTAPGQYAHPDLLKHVLGHLAVPGQKQQVPQKPVLITHNQLIQQSNILPLKSFRYSKILLPNQLFGCGEAPATNNDRMAETVLILLN